MSTQTRTAGSGSRNQKKSSSGGGGGGGGETNVGNKKSDVSKVEKEKSQPKPTAEQIRIAQITDISSGSEDPKMREKVATLMEMTQRSEEEVCCALYECDNNLEKAVVFLLETLPVGAFETSSKKKKNRVANAVNEGTTDGEWVEASTNNDTRERSRNRSGTRGGRGGSDSRGWRGREARENERNTADSKSGGEGGGWRGGRGGRGGSRGGYGGRGGRGGRMGPRGMGPRDYGRNNYNRQQQEPQEVDTWDNTIATNADQNKQDDAWGDWDNEEYVGSLKDTKVFTPSNLQNQTMPDTWGDWDNEEYVGSLKDSKVFTPSNLQNQSMPVNSDLPAPPGLEQQILNPPPQMTADDLVQQYSTTVVSSTTTAAAVAAAVNPVQYQDMHGANSQTQNQQMRALEIQQQLNATSTLSPEQSQYFNSLPSQNTSQQGPVVNSYQTSAVQYPTSYGTSTVYGDQVASSQPSVRRARAKVPPPSKIPSTAVEMPGDTLNNIGYLDVQFGGLEFGAEESFETLTDKFNSTTLTEAQQTGQSQDVSNEYQPKSNAQSALTAGLQSSQIIPNSDALSSAQTENLTSGYSQRSSNSVQQQNVSASINTGATNALEQLTKNDPYNQTNSSNTSGYQSSYSAGSSNKQTPSYQNAAAAAAVQAYSSNNYANTQVSTGNTYQPSSNNYNSYNQNSVNSYQQQSSAVVNNSSNSSGGNVVNSSSAAQNISVGGSNSTVNNSSSNTNAGYLSSQYQSNQTTSAFPSQQSAYQNSQSVYGNTGLTNNTGFTGSTNTSSSQYSNFSSSKLKDTTTPASTPFERFRGTLGASLACIYKNAISRQGSKINSSKRLTQYQVEQPYEGYNGVSSVSSSTVVSSTVSSVSSSSVTTNSMSSPSLGLPNAKVTSTTAKSTGGVVPNIQMVSQYIQTGVPYYQQPAAVYSYEDIQMMQQRMPHMTQYYDINYPPTSLGAAGVRDANLGSVAYSTMTDGRFTRTDNNSSPVSNVSSTMSQQAGSSGPMLNLPYAYFYGGNMMPGSFQYGTPAIYPQQMPAANATSGGQFPKPSYNSGYGSATYDALSQATQDYSKGTYPGTGVSQQSKGQSVTNPPQAGTGSDISSSMYGKSHVALNKVNSYEKQSFHSGTPPPFNLTGTQTAGATSAQPYGMYIQPMPAGHHNMNIHQPIHQMDGRIHNSSRRDSNSTGQRQQTSSQSKSATKQGYSPSYWTAQN